MKFKLKITKILALLSISIICLSCNAQKNPTPEQQNIINKAKANFVFVKGGDFIMGKAPYPEPTPEHQVTLDGFSMSKYETTFKEFDTYTSLNGLDSIKPKWRHRKDMGPNFGVTFVTWQQSKDYCLWLGKQLNLPIDLPTEAQWEYAARSRGLDVNHATNNGKIEGNFKTKRNYPVTDTVVGAYPPNPLGLYDMSGGRPEWTRDWIHGYRSEALINPRFDSIQVYKERVVRGFHTLGISVYNRGSREPDNSGSGVGFRCVCNQTTPVN